MQTKLLPEIDRKFPQYPLADVDGFGFISGIHRNASQTLNLWSSAPNWHLYCRGVR